MGQVKCDFMEVGPVQANCYFVSNEDTKECIIIDAGDDERRIINYIEDKKLKPVAILLTHGHFDHIGAVEGIREKYGIKVYAAQAEEEVLKDVNINLSAQLMGGAISLKADELLSDGQEINLIGEKIRCILTPGHTVGGMCYYFTNSGYLFSGDTLFQQSVGRTDFPGGSMSTLIRSIREKLFVLPEYIRVYPGHGMTTSIKEEKMLNPFAAE